MIIILIFLCCLGTAFACPPEIIRTPEQLQSLNENGCLGASYVLANDIDLSGKTWVPIGNSSNPFSGKLDGKGHKAFGFNINSPSTDYVGLFGYVSSGAEIKNISVKIDGTVKGKDYVGGLVGYNLGKISKSYVAGNVSGNQYVGSLAGKNEGTISDCYATMGRVLGSKYVGGLAGSSNGTIKNNYFVGSISPITAACKFVSKEGQEVDNLTVAPDETTRNPIVICHPSEAIASGVNFSKTSSASSYSYNITSAVCDGIVTSNLPTCGTVTIGESSSSVAVSSSSLADCAYEARFCGGDSTNKNLTINTTTKPEVGKCVFVKTITHIRPASGGGTISINGGSDCNEVSTECTLPPVEDGGYYVYLKSGAFSGNQGWEVTSGSPACNISQLPISLIAPDSIITLGLNPGKYIRELNFNWYSGTGTGTEKSFVRIFKNNVLVNEFTGKVGDAGSGYQWHKATATGLEPNTPYTYKVSNDSINWSKEYNYKTPPASGSFKFAAIADPQHNCGSDVSKECTAEVIGPWQGIAAKIAAAGATLIVNAGDHTEYGREHEFRGYFSPPVLRNIPTASVMGNHDGVVGKTTNFNYHFNLPSLQTGSGKYVYGNSNYYFLYNRVLFIGLNSSPYPDVPTYASETSDASVYISDFRKTIDAAKAAHSPLQYDFIVVVHHKSTNSITNCTNDDCSTKNGHTLDPDVIAYVDAGIQKLMTEKGVDLVLTGHNHIYVRSQLMKNDKPSTDGTGTIYLTLKPAGRTRNYSGIVISNNFYSVVGYTDTQRANFTNVYPYINKDSGLKHPTNFKNLYFPESYANHSLYSGANGSDVANPDGVHPGYSIIEVNGNKMTVKIHEDDGSVFDQFDITPTLPKF